MLFIIVDTEEEFDWRAPLSRANTSVRAMRRVHTLQEVFATRGFVPTYVVDFPVASQAEGYGPLAELARDGRARIGAHLHPWVNPPFTEALAAGNSFGCALGEALETEKIRVLRACIANAFGFEPRVYKAGRYGFGPTTAAALELLGFDVDVSVNPRMDFSAEGGPSFEAFPPTPFFFGRQRRLLELPCTTDYTGVAGAAAPGLHRLIRRGPLDRLHVPGVLARLGVVNKIMLSPETATLREMKTLTRTLLRRGVRTFSMTMHSPSAQPGCTPYVRTNDALERFLGRTGAYLDFFLGELGGIASTPEDFLDSLTAIPPASAAVRSAAS
jgi:hypothetical protein